MNRWAAFRIEHQNRPRNNIDERKKGDARRGADKRYAGLGSVQGTEIETWRRRVQNAACQAANGSRKIQAQSRGRGNCTYYLMCDAPGRGAPIAISGIVEDAPDEPLEG